jgi:hypothetical protein
MDLNARENILDTAEKRESVLRIARMLSYKPKRVQPAEGLLQITSAKTTEQIIDSSGSNLSNQVITWGSDPSELDYERFIKIIDTALGSTNKFGTPSQKVTNSVTGDRFEIYQFNNINRKTSYGISALTDGLNLNFDMLPAQLSSDGIIEQLEPAETNAFSMIYRNDGRGTGSIRTGFFTLAKQGYQQSQVFKFDSPLANAVIDLTGSGNISEDDFYVQSLDSTGKIIKTWSRVGAFDFSNIVVNEFGNANKDLFEVLYSSADITSIKFGDGLFSNAASGYIRVWYRLAEDNFIKVKAGEISNKLLEIDYVNADGEQHTLELTLTLQENMTTGIPSENTDEIKINAPEAFYSKNRMVTGDDYAGFLPTLNNDVLLLKTENRTFSGHSRYVDLSDPSGKSRPLVELGDDGYLYYDENIKTVTIADKSGVRPVDFIENNMESKLADFGFLNFYYGKLDLTESGATSLFSLIDVTALDLTWRSAYLDATTSNGYISMSSANTEAARLGFTTYGELRSVRPGSMLKFVKGTSVIWANVTDIKGNGLGQENSNGTYTGLLYNGHGCVEINKRIEDTYKLEAIVPPLPRVFDELTTGKIATFIADKKPFAVQYDHIQNKWTILDTSIYAINKLNNWDSSSQGTSWLMYLTRSAESWVINYRSLDYVFGSDNLIRFYNLNFASTLDPNYKAVGNDNIKVLTMSSNKIVTQATYRITGYYNYKDGYTDNSKVKITPLDVDVDLLPDDPNHFIKVVGNNTIGLKEYKEDEFVYLIPTTATDPLKVDTVPGTTGLAFKWEHNTPIDQTLNPSLTNIVDVYVLTKSYNNEFTKWKKKGATGVLPEAPTSEELRRSFYNLKNYKMATDEVIFHPVTFKPLFGASAGENLQATFKVVKHPKSKMTDNEIKSKVLVALETFFTPGNFDFGESFYFTELAAYIHTQLKEDINSVIIVPVNAESTFGALFQITPNNDELVTTTATVNDIVVIKEITDQNIRKA